MSILIPKGFHSKETIQETVKNYLEENDRTPIKIMYCGESEALLFYEIFVIRLERGNLSPKATYFEERRKMPILRLGRFEKKDVRLEMAKRRVLKPLNR